MPHSMDFPGQANKWFSMVIFISLPFIVCLRIITGKVPPLSEIGPERK